MSVRQMRLVVAAADYEAAVRFYRDALGLEVELSVAGPGGAEVTILQAGRATLELANPAQVAFIDEMEVGRDVSPHLRVAFEVDDSAFASDRLAAAGATVLAAPTRTPWDSLNARLAGPGDLQLTLFQELQRPTTGTSWNALLLDQFEFQWSNGLRPRLEGLTDDEYLWEPAPGAWSVRPRGAPSPASPVGEGEFAMDRTAPTPEPAPVTTIAWRLNHLLTTLAIRSASHFGREPVDHDTYPYAGTAADALAHLDEEHDIWVAGVKSLGEEGLLRPCGPAEGPFAADPMAALVLHIHRELLHHGAEICLLRDLYPHLSPSAD